MIELFIATNASGEVTRTAYWDGFDDFCRGAQLEDMPSEEHVRGWFFACRCEGDTLDLIEYQGETDFIRTGGAR